MFGKTAIILTALMMVCSGSAILAVDSSEAENSEDIDVFLLAGQSNAAYGVRSTPETASPVCPVGVGYFFGAPNRPVPYEYWNSSATYGIYDMVNSDGTAKIGGIEQPFAATYYEETGHKVCVINVAVGGATIARWSVDGVFYVWAQEVFGKGLTALENAGFNPICKGLVWIQGESDSTTEISDYKARFTAMFDSMSHSNSENGYFNDDYSLDNCIISLVRQSTGLNACMAQVQIDAESEDAKLGCIVCDQFTPENGLLMDDDLHYSQLGLNVVAENLAKNFHKLF